MQDLRLGPKKAIQTALEGYTWRRADSLKQYFAPDAVFLHLACAVEGRDNIVATFKFWNLFNRKLKTEFLRIVPDTRNNRVMVDVLATFSFWWWPGHWLNIPWLIVPQIVLVHVIFDVEDGPQGKAVRYQEDHHFFVESLFYICMPRSMVDALNGYVKPLNGKLVASLGNFLSKTAASVRHQEATVKVRHTGLDPWRVHQELEEALNAMLGGSYADSFATVSRVYAPGAQLDHPAVLLTGREQILAAFQFLGHCNCRLRAKVKHIVATWFDSEIERAAHEDSDKRTGADVAEDLILADVDEHVWPWWWPAVFPPIVICHYFVLTVCDSPWGGKMITRHEDHILVLESLLEHNLGPISWLYTNIFLPLNGRIVAVLGDLLYAMLWNLHDKVASRAH